MGLSVRSRAQTHAFTSTSHRSHRHNDGIRSCAFNWHLCSPQMHNIQICKLSCETDAQPHAHMHCPIIITMHTTLGCHIRSVLRTTDTRVEQERGWGSSDAARGFLLISIGIVRARFYRFLAARLLPTCRSPCIRREQFLVYVSLCVLLFRRSHGSHSRRK